MNKSQNVAPVTPYRLRASHAKALNSKTCGTVTPVTPYTRRRTPARAHTDTWVSYVSQGLHISNNNNLHCDTRK